MSLNIKVSSSAELARQVLIIELQRATRVVNLPHADSYRGVQVYLTYMSPQVIEAVVADKAAQESLTLVEGRHLLAEFDRRLQIRNSIPFLLAVRGDHRDTVFLGQLDKNMVLVNQRHKRIPALAEYTSALAQPIDMGGGGLEGYVLFPRSVGSDCTPSVDLLNDHSFDIRLTRIQYADCGWLGLWEEYESLSVLWPYTLLPDVPLEEALDIPLPQRATAGIDQSIMMDILSLALTVFELMISA